MVSKKLKYIEYLKDFDNCPSNDFVPIDGKYCRWVQFEDTDKNFLNLSIVKNPPQRLLGDEDKLCSSYGLSFFDTFQNAFKTYHKRYLKQNREQLKKIWKEDKGTHIAVIDIDNGDGIANAPDQKSGHFTFHEYEHVELDSKIFQRLNIFDENGTIKEKI